MSGAAAEGQANICSLSVARPSCFSLDDMAEKHIWPKIISSQTAKQTSSRPCRRDSKSLSSFLPGFSWSYFQKRCCEWSREKKPNLAGADLRREAEFIPCHLQVLTSVVSAYALKPGLVCCKARLLLLCVSPNPTLECKPQPADTV